jgi:hypothetical protein
MTERWTAVAATNWQQKWGQLVAKAWSDPKFKAKLLADPNAVLKTEGVPVPAGVQFKVVECSEKTVYLSLPYNPGTGELSEEDLKQVAGGAVKKGCETCSISYYGC